MRPRPRTLVSLALLALAVVLASALPWLPDDPEESRGAPATPARPPAEAPRGEGTTARVAHVFDGDSVVLRDGRQVRYLGIDCPEAGEPGSEKARMLNRRLVEDKEVILHFAGRIREDRHGRLLAVVSVPPAGPRGETRCVNVELVREGIAWIYFDDAADLPEEVKEPLVLAQVEALTHHRGIWTRWLAAATGRESALVATRLRLHLPQCPELAGRSTQPVASILREFAQGKSPCRKCRPLR